MIEKEMTKFEATRLSGYKYGSISYSGFSHIQKKKVTYARRRDVRMAATGIGLRSARQRPTSHNQRQPSLTSFYANSQSKTFSTTISL
jgi:hypothetical protein